MTKKGKKKASAAKEDEPTESSPARRPSLFKALKVPDVQKVVKLEFRLMNWNFLDFELECPTDTHVFTLKKKIIERHGRIKDLVVCKESYEEQNELTDDMKTLEEYGILGGTADDNVVARIFYEFKPCDHDDPLLLHIANEDDVPAAGAAHK